jgi:hypothetical protein
VEIVENGELTVSCDGAIISGFVDREKRCPSCGQLIVYCDKYDAYLCAACNKWLESQCNDPACGYCPNRPPVPFPDRANERS